MFMCGIAAVVGRELDRESKENILRSMAHRGPDGSGVWEKENCVLLHSRLAIIDPELGGQPMALQWGQKRYTMVYNGELYNTLELRRELEGLGHRLLTRSDTEVVLRSYAQWGQECLERFNGIYAMAIWEEKSKELFIARDRIGVKPLFYTEFPGGIALASEIKTLFRVPGITPRLDAQGAAQVLMLGPGRLPGSGVFYGIREVEPGCCGTFAQGKLRLRRYWKLRDREHTQSFEETAQQVRCLVTDAIRRQTVSDVPWGAFLSGGLDSSLICSVCAGALAEEGRKLRTFSVDYAGNGENFHPTKFQPDADSTYIRIMTHRLGSVHRDVVLDTPRLLGALEEATVARDLPGMADVDFSMLLLCREMSRDVKMALSGECADEIFGGYPWYRDPEVRQREGFPWAQSTAWRESFLAPWVRGRVSGRELVEDAYQTTLRESDIAPNQSATEKRLKEMVNLNFRWFMQTLLDRKDRMSMHSGLEVRVPFCDHRIAEYLYGVPWEFKDYKGKEKGLLRHAMAAYLPREVLWRKKSPYPKTFDPEYTRLAVGQLQQLLQRENAPIFSIVDRSALEALPQAKPQWPWYGQLMNVPQTVSFMLQINCWLETYKIELIG